MQRFLHTRCYLAPQHQAYSLNGDEYQQAAVQTVMPVPDHYFSLVCCLPVFEHCLEQMLWAQLHPSIENIHTHQNYSRPSGLFTPSYNSIGKRISNCK